MSSLFYFILLCFTGVGWHSDTDGMRQSVLYGNLKSPTVNTGLQKALTKDFTQN